MKPSSPGWKLKKKLLEKKKAENFLSPWTKRNIVLDETSFSFEGHEYLREIYEQHHNYMVIEKASQMGLSIFALSKSIWFCDTQGGKVIYWFPSQGDINDFSQDRFRPICRESEYLQGLIAKDSVDKTQLVQIGKGSLYFRGLFHSQRSRDGKSGAKVKSVDADFLVFDELDEAMPKQKDAAKHRVDHSHFKWILELSTPTIPDYGIDVEFQRSDQRFWMLKCPHCGEWNCTEETFPKCLVRTGEETVILACRKCRKELDPAAGEWVARHPNRKKRRGYHICQLYSTFIDLNDVLTEYEDPQTDRTIFYNHRLGLPHIEAVDRLQREEVYACCVSELTFPGRGTSCSMGADVGPKDLIVCISERHPSGRRRIVFLGKVKEFKDLDPLMKRFGVGCCVIDAQPETHSARDFAKRHKQRVYLCYYQDGLKGEYKWTDRDEHGVGVVNVNRTESLDATLIQFREQEIILPSRTLEIEELASHCHALVRKREANTAGEISFKYVQIGDDHYAHARNYCRVAETKCHNTSSRAGSVGSYTFDWRQQ